MFGISGTELIIILLFAFLIVGPDKLPDAARTIGKGIAKFKEAQNQMNDVIKTETETIKSEVNDAMNADKEKKASQAKPAAASSAATKRTSSDSAKTQSAASQAEKSATVATGATGVTVSSTRSMSFSERKAKYEAERAAKRAEEEKAAAEAAAASDKDGE